MKTRFLQKALVAIAGVGMILPQGALAAPTVTAKVQKSDVALRDGGTLVGQVVDAQGKPLAETEVALYFQGVEVVRTMTDKKGVFAAKGLRGGEYTLVSAGGQVNYRLWTPQTAPPAASNGVLVVTGDSVINGQQGGGLVGFVKSHPLLVAGGVAAAIAIPLAVADDDDAS